MKCTLVLAALASLVAAQSVVIHAPAPQSTFSPGDKFVVDVERVVRSIRTSFVRCEILTTESPVEQPHPLERRVRCLGLLSCADDATDGNCSGDGTDIQIGRVLFSGPYAPTSVPGTLGFAQNYTVTVPADFPVGSAALSVAHFFLLGSQTVRALCGCRSICDVLNVLGTFRYLLRRTSKSAARSSTSTEDLMT